MKESEIKALVSLLDDKDQEVATIVEQQIKSLGEVAIPFLAAEWGNDFDAKQQQRIEDLIHELQFTALLAQLKTWKNENSEDMIEGMWLIVKYLHPDFLLSQLKEQLNQIYFEAWIDFKSDLHPTDQIRKLNEVFFNRLKFGSNTKNFHSASNSMLNVVMDTKKGNPISLCVIYMLVAQKLGIPIFGVNLPNLFVLTYKTEQLQFYVNVFNRGIIFTKNDIDHFIAQAKLPKSDVFYEPCSHLDIIKRVLRNLAIAYEKTADETRQQEIILMMQALE